LGNGGGETQNNHGEREKDSGNNIISKKYFWRLSLLRTGSVRASSFEICNTRAEGNAAAAYNKAIVEYKDIEVRSLVHIVRETDVMN